MESFRALLEVLETSQSAGGALDERRIPQKIDQIASYGLSRTNVLGRSVWAISVPSIGWSEDVYRIYRAEAAQQLVRAALALRCYHLEHGRLPESLSALVPEYLPEIPRDPYDRAPIRYSRESKRVWCIGVDLVDKGGAGDEETGEDQNRFGNRGEPTLSVEF